MRLISKIKLLIYPSRAELDVLILLSKTTQLLGPTTKKILKKGLFRPVHQPSTNRLIDEVPNNRLQFGLTD